MSKSDDDDALARQQTLVKSAEDMAREHSARREIRMREDRVRHLSSAPSDGQSHSEVNRVRAIEAQKSAPEPRESSTSDSNAKLSAPFAPISSDRKHTARSSSSESKAPRSSNAAKAPRESKDARESKDPRRSGTSANDDAGARATSNKRASRAPDELQLSAVDELAIEIEDLFRRTKNGWQSLTHPDRATVVAAILTLAGTLTPWVSAPGRPHQLGIFVGGVFHAALAVTALALVVYRASEGWIGSFKSADRMARRVSLYHVLIGALSTFIGAIILVYWGFMKTPAHPVVIHAGFYATLCCGTGLSYGGFARFGRRRGHGS